MIVLKNIPIILFSIIICSHALAVEPRTKPAVQVEGEESESPVWITFLPKSPIRSLKEYSHMHRTSPRAAAPLYKPVPIPDCGLEIRRAADQKRVARVPHAECFGADGFTGRARRRIGQLPDGEYLLAFCVRDRCAIKRSVRN